MRVVCRDLLAFPHHLVERPHAILCMDDPITHLPDIGAVETLVHNAAAALDHTGIFVVSLHDYSVPLLGDQRHRLVDGGCRVHGATGLRGMARLVAIKR